MRRLYEGSVEDGGLGSLGGSDNFSSGSGMLDDCSMLSGSMGGVAMLALERREGRPVWGIDVPITVCREVA